MTARRDDNYRANVRLSALAEIAGLRAAVFLVVVGRAAAMPAWVHSQSPAPRAGHVMTSAGPGGGVLTLGGQILDNSPRLVDSLWRWDGSTWQVLSGTGPRNRTMPGAAFDTHRGVLVVYGGRSIGTRTRYGDLWEWNGKDWAERNVLTPGPRDHHAMTYDEARRTTVMFGGIDADRYVWPRGTWTWNGSAWNLADSVTGPGGLVHHAMAYDSRRQRVVLVGGSDSAGQASAGTWEWDGVRWERVTTEGPGARTRHRLAYDAARGETVLFGGQIGTGRTATFPEDTWTWDGTKWKQHSTPGPTPRYVHAMAYDSRRQRVVLFGGGSLSPGGAPPYGYRADIWEWDGAQWRPGGA